MSFSFFKPSKAGSSPSDLVKAMRESLLALDTKTVAKVSTENPDTHQQRSLETWQYGYLLELTSFELFFKYVELPNFDIASDALATFKDSLTKHETAVAQFLGSHYEQVSLNVDKIGGAKLWLECDCTTVICQISHNTLVLLI
ncbi:hypothetical protein COCNU_scaffold039443G000020 [Cocos nucifera]|nr:hypothetical protein [Cocos nucifera]